MKRAEARRAHGEWVSTTTISVHFFAHSKLFVYFWIWTYRIIEPGKTHKPGNSVNRKTPLTETIINFDAVIHDFAAKKARKISFRHAK